MFLSCAPAALALAISPRTCSLCSGGTRPLKLAASCRPSASSAC